MKESMKRIVVWARKHPWLAALIVAAVILLGYLAYKRSSSSGGGETNTTLPEGSDQASPIPSMGDIPSSVSTGGGGSVPSSDVGVSTTSGSNEIPFGGGKLPEIPSVIPTNFGGINDSWSPSLDMAIADTLSSTVDRRVSNASGRKGLIGNTGAEKKGAKPGELAARVRKNNPLAQRKASKTKGQTPAQQLGKGRLYTGLINGVYYVNGFPVGSSPIPGSVTMPGGRTVSKQILGVD